MFRVTTNSTHYILDPVVCCLWFVARLLLVQHLVPPRIQSGESIRWAPKSHPTLLRNIKPWWHQPKIHLLHVVSWQLSHRTYSRLKSTGTIQPCPRPIVPSWSQGEVLADPIQVTRSMATQQSHSREPPSVEVTSTCETNKPNQQHQSRYLTWRTAQLKTSPVKSPRTNGPVQLKTWSQPTIYIQATKPSITIHNQTSCLQIVQQECVGIWDCMLAHAS